MNSGHKKRCSPDYYDTPTASSITSALRMAPLCATALRRRLGYAGLRGRLNRGRVAEGERVGTITLISEPLTIREYSNESPDIGNVGPVKPMAVDLFCGLGGWTEGLLAEGYDVVGFDNVQHVYGEHRYPAQLVLQDVLTLHGRQFKDAALIVASPPCQAYSYRAMPWKRAKALPPPDNSLFEACFRIQREASEAAGNHIPLVVENVKGAQKWVGRARWNFGSFYLWGDVPALMPIARAAFKSSGLNWSDRSRTGQDFTRRAGEHAIKNGGGSWFNVAHNTTSGKGQNPDGRKNGGRLFPNDCADRRGVKRKFASAQIAKIPLPLARHIAAIYKPRLAA